MKFDGAAFKKLERLNVGIQDFLPCKNCGKKHPSKAENECWELEKKQSQPPNDVEVDEEHLEVCGVLNRNRDVTTWCDTRYNNGKSIIPGDYELLDPTRQRQ